MADWGPSIKYVTLFLANFDPPSLCHTLSHIPGPPESTPHIPDPPIFSTPSTKIPDNSPLYKFYLNCSQRFLSGGFCPGWFLSVPPSVTQQKVKHHFKFHVSYVGPMIKICISVTSHALYPPLPTVTDCHTFSDLLPPRA